MNVIKVPAGLDDGIMDIIEYGVISICCIAFVF